MVRAEHPTIRVEAEGFRIGQPVTVERSGGSKEVDWKILEFKDDSRGIVAVVKKNDGTLQKEIPIQDLVEMNKAGVQDEKRNREIEWLSAKDKINAELQKLNGVSFSEVQFEQALGNIKSLIASYNNQFKTNQTSGKGGNFRPVDNNSLSVVVDGKVKNISLMWNTHKNTLDIWGI